MQSVVLHCQVEEACFVFKMEIWNAAVGILLATLMLAAKAEWISIKDVLTRNDISNGPVVNLSLAWEEEAGIRKTILLTLLRIEDLETNIPIFSLDQDDGMVKQINNAVLQNTQFYQDVDNHGAISFTRHSEDRVEIRGSFGLGDDLYSIEPYHSGIHKRNAEIGDHIVLKRDTRISTTVDYILPLPGTEQWDIMKQSMELYNSRFGMTVKQSRTLTATKHQVQLYILVDSYLYTRLSAISQLAKWSAGADNFVAYYIGHLANEIDVHYRSIPNNTLSISTILSYIYIAKTPASNPYSAGSVNENTLQGDSGVLLRAMNDWVERNKANLPSDADHYMLQTGLDLTLDGSAANAGLAYLGGACLNTPVSVNEYKSSHVAAHELGHNLGARHDGDNNNCTGNDMFVMSAQWSNNYTLGNRWRFSSCSMNYIQSYIETVNAQGKNCLLNKGAYISSWSNDSSSKVGQAIPVEQQCQLLGVGWVFAGAQLNDNICKVLWCWDVPGDRGVTIGAALQYTTCGNQMWCDKERCVYDADAPSVDPNCVFGDKKGKLYVDSDLTCTTITGEHCYEDYVRTSCCAACKNFLTGRTGCEYGDKASWCATEPIYNCVYEAEVATPCCERCLRHATGIKGCEFGDKADWCSNETYPNSCNDNADTCCVSCLPYATPWLGVDCPYGDKASWCATLAINDCPANRQTCCQTCCTVNCSKPTEPTKRTTTKIQSTTSAKQVTSKAPKTTTSTKSTASKTTTKIPEASTKSSRPQTITAVPTSASTKTSKPASITPSRPQTTTTKSTTSMKSTLKMTTRAPTIKTTTKTSTKWPTTKLPLGK